MKENSGPVPPADSKHPQGGTENPFKIAVMTTDNRRFVKNVEAATFSEACEEAKRMVEEGHGIEVRRVRKAKVNRPDPQIGLGSAVRKLRKEQGLNRKTLALRSGLSPRFLVEVEEGETNPGWGNVRRLASGLEIPLPELAALAVVLDEPAEDQQKER